MIFCTRANNCTDRMHAKWGMAKNQIETSQIIMRCKTRFSAVNSSNARFIWMCPNGTRKNIKWPFEWAASWNFYQAKTVWKAKINSALVRNAIWNDEMIVQPQGWTLKENLMSRRSRSDVTWKRARNGEVEEGHAMNARKKMAKLLIMSITSH